MYRRKLLPTFLVFFCVNTYAQNKVNFEITLSETKTSHSLYNSIDLADTRTDTNSFGFVQTGAFNRNGKVVLQAPFAAELKRILGSLVDSAASNGELLLQVRQFNFAETTGALGEHGYCAIKAEMYAKKGTAYQKINAIDTLIHLRSSIDVTNKTLRAGSQQLTAFIQSSLVIAPANDVVMYNYNDIAHIDSVEKRALKVYNTTTYADGLYLTYNSFKKQVPDKGGVTVANDYLFEGNVKAPDDKGKLRDVKLKKTYAIVYKGAPYIATAYGFYPLAKVNDEFIFTGMAKTPPNPTSVMVASAAFGLLGALAVSVGDEGTYEMKIDHQNGSIIKLKEIPAPKATGTSRNDGWD
ncbi:hypothetical protein IDJ77_00180 [Mucilaginibacter sp. ZT4R22]|uniref:Uncharacterized protein n=1 Tax=Mucilaginibacter pankratovii TaxID=2772110 RepID=A0ABR7WIU2_9SPHI|nr:hypothetical protein [Mucilaginibacter pankratovii]MBD1362210.1 hypothetical protein [Mucilaginibacter pankratovii]